MSSTVARVQTPADFERLHRLLIAYERALPADLRHRREPAVAEVRDKYRGGNAAFLACIEREYGGCTVVTAFDHTTAVFQRLYVLPAPRASNASFWTPRNGDVHAARVIAAISG